MLKCQVEEKNNHFADRNKQAKLKFSRETITSAVHPVQQSLEG